MSKINEVLRLKYGSGMSHRQIALLTSLSKGVVGKYVSRAAAAGITGWPLPDGLDEHALEARLFPKPAETPQRFVEPDWFVVHQKLKLKGETLQRLWAEHAEAHGPRARRYTQYTRHYKAWRVRQKRSMRQQHRAGEKLFIDHCGPTIDVIDQRTGEVRSAQIFVAVLGASSYTYAEATWTQRSADWIESNRRALEFLGGVPELLIPDNLKSAVTTADRYEPVVNATYQEFATHYGTAVLPTRPLKPQDKAKAEAGVLLVERWIIAALRYREFFTLVALNEAIKGLVTALNARPFQGRRESRADLFKVLDKPALRALPERAYEYAEWRHAKVGIDYHIEFKKIYYSVPHRVVGEHVDVRASASTIEVMHRGRRIAAHARDAANPQRFRTDPEHMPVLHRAHAEWSPTRFLDWGGEIGLATVQLVRHQLENRPHPEHGYRSCLGLLSLAKRYGKPRLEAACAQALALGTMSTKSVRSILTQGLDLIEQDAVTGEVQGELPLHDNVRGAQYYH